MNSSGKIFRNGITWPQQGHWLLLYNYIHDNEEVLEGGRKAEMQRLMLVGLKYEQGLSGTDQKTRDKIQASILDIKKKLASNDYKHDQFKINNIGRVRRNSFAWPLHGEWLLLYDYLYGENSLISNSSTSAEMLRLMFIGFKHEHHLLQPPVNPSVRGDNNRQFNQETQQSVKDTTSNPPIYTNDKPQSEQKNIKPDNFLKEFG